MTHASDMREQTLLGYAGSSAALRLASISARQAFWCEVPGGEAMACEPDEELLEAGLRVGKAAVAHALADQQGYVELGFADVDAENVHEASEPVTLARPCCHPCNQAFRHAGALDTVQPRDG